MNVKAGMLLFGNNLKKCESAGKGRRNEEREEEDRGWDITVYTKILYQAIVLQLGPEPHHT